MPRCRATITIMCSRYLLSASDLSIIPDRFDIDQKPEWFLDAEPDYRPTLLLPAVTVKSEGRSLEELRWGLIPPWAKDASEGMRAFNARAEGIAAKPTFRKAVRERRCLLPASAYFEWQNIGEAVPVASKKSAQRKQPWRFTVGNETEPELFAFAGIWDVWKNPANGEWLRSAAMITCEPNTLAEGIHNRMPVILPREAEGIWLDPKTPLPDALGLLAPYTGEMHVERWSFEPPTESLGL